MKTLIAIDTVTWIERLRYASDEASLTIYLDPSLSPLSVFLAPGPYAEGTWQEFLALPTVHCFERGGSTYAYNFAKVDQAMISGHWGNFVFSREQDCIPHAAYLEPLHVHGLDRALSAYRLWLHAQAQREPSLHLQALLTILVPAERCDQESERLDSLFPGISLCSTITSSLSACCWAFPLNTWLTEEQTMFLGLYEHVIRFPGGEQEEWLQRRLPSLFLPLPSSRPFQVSSRVREAHPLGELPAVLSPPRSARTRFRLLLVRGAGLSCALTVLFAWYWLRRDAEGRARQADGKRSITNIGPTNRGRDKR